MSARQFFSALLGFLLALVGCTKQDGSVNSLRELVDQLEAASSSPSPPSGSARVRVELAGTLIFASPHAIDGRLPQLAAAVGAKTAEKLGNKTGLSESFHIFFVSSNGHIEALRWDEPLFVFNDLFIVKCQPGSQLNFDIQEKTLRGIKVEQQ